MQKKQFYKIASTLLSVMLALVILPVIPAYAASTITSTATGGPWNSGSTWVGGVVPGAADSVVIASGATVTLDVAPVINGSLTIETGATLVTDDIAMKLGDNFINNGTFMAGNSNLEISGFIPQSIAGFTTGGNVSMTKSGDVATFTGDVNAAALTINGTGGTLNLGSGLAHTFSGTWTNTTGTLDGGSSTLTINGAASITGGTFTGNSSTLNLNGTVTKTGGTFTPGATVIYGGAAQTVIAATYNNLTLSGSGVKTIKVGSTVNGILSMEGTAIASTAPAYGGAATLQYNTDTARSVGPEWTTTFGATGGIVIANTGAITMNGGKTLSAGVPLTINNGAALSTNNSALTLGGDFTNNGTFSAGTSIVTMYGSFTNTGIFSQSNFNVVITGTAATQSIAGFPTTGATTGTVSMTKTAGTATFTGNVNAGGLTINGVGGTLDLGSGLVHTFRGTWARTAGTVNGDSSILNLYANGGSSVSGLTFTFTANTCTVNYAGVAQTVANLTYNNLNLGGSGVKTLTGLSTINGDLSLSTTTPGTTTTTATLTHQLDIGGNLTIGAGTTLDVSSSDYALNVGGDWTNSGTGTFIPRAGTVTLNGASAQTISVTPATAYNNLSINNPAGVMLSTNASVNGVLTLTSGKIITGDSSLIIGTGGTVAGASPAMYVFGNLQKNFTTGAPAFTFDIGDATNYTPVAVSFANVSTAGNVTARHSRVIIPTLPPLSASTGRRMSTGIGR